MSQIDLTQVAGALRYGRYNEKNRKKYNIAFIVYAIIIVFALVGTVIDFSFEIAENPSLTNIFLLVFVICFYVLCLLPFLVLVVRQERIRKEILKWSEDAVETYAHSKCVGETDGMSRYGSFFNLIFGPRFAKIEVKFEIQGKCFTKMSGKTQRLGTTDGFSMLWLKYRDRAIRILYSPKYDQVIVLKDKENDKK